MHEWILDVLADPTTHQPLQVAEIREREDGAIREGWLKAYDGAEIPIHDGIPRFVGTDRPDTQVATSFGYKWSKRSSYETPTFIAWYRHWLLEKYGFGDQHQLADHFSRFTRVLEVGCGSGLSSVISLEGLRPDQQWVGLDLSTAIDVARDRIGEHPNTAFVQGDALALPFKRTSFDAVFSEGVLHHTSSASSRRCA